MPKTLRMRYRCDNCEYEQVGFFGICPRCGEGNGIEVTASQVADRAGRVVPRGSRPAARFVDLADVSATEHERVPSGLGELDRVLGGGIVPGSYIALTGVPGAGKTTMATQAVLSLAGSGRRVAYVAGEESASQARMCYERLGAKFGSYPLPITTEVSAERICRALEENVYDFVVVDSIQTIFSEGHTGRPGSIGQVAECAEQLRRVAKETGTAILLIVQITKGGDMAGPNTLAHMVDAVLHFESDKDEQLRILRAIKNRFGSIDEIGVFEMTGAGLDSVGEPSKRFLADRDTNLPGSAVCAVLEGTRVVLCEIQALVRPSNAPIPQRDVWGIDRKRLSMLLAVMETSSPRLAIGSHEVFVKVLGGLRVAEPACDLAVAQALLSALTGRAVRADICAFGEVTLQGKVRAATQSERRSKEAERLGYRSLPGVGGLLEILESGLENTNEG